MPPKRVPVPLKAQLERAESKGLKQGRKNGMADLLALLSAGDDGFIPDYSDRGYGCYSNQDFSWQARLDAAMLNAASQDDMELVQIFVDAGANINAYNKEHRTPLQCAVEEGNIKMVKALLKAGASVPTEDYDHDYDDEYVSPLACAVKQGNMPMIKILLAAGAHGDEPGDEGWLIDYEAEGDQVEITRAFINAGAYLGPYNYDENQTPLMLAIRWGKTKSAALLIKAGSDVNSNEAYDDTTALMIAAEGEEGYYSDTIRLLLMAGAEVNSKNELGLTALMLAAEAGRIDAVRLLLSAGADVFYRAPSRREMRGEPAVKAGNALDRAADDAVKEILKSEMHRRIAAALSVLPMMPEDVRKKIIELYLWQPDLEEIGDVNADAFVQAYGTGTGADSGTSSDSDSGTDSDSDSSSTSSSTSSRRRGSSRSSSSSDTDTDSDDSK